MKICDYINQLIADSLQELGITSDSIFLEHPANPAHGDYSTNTVFTTFPKLSADQRLKLEVCNPRELAQLLVGKLQTQLAQQEPKLVSQVKTAGPGFINFYLSDFYYFKKLAQLIAEKSVKLDKTAENRTMIIDYSAPNIAKRFTIGHLRSTIIGQAIYNIYQALGWKTIGDNHLGDWGTQFGKMIVAINKWAEKDISQLTIAEMEKLYVLFHQKAQEDESLNDEARQAFKNLEEGRDQEQKMWQQLVERSMQEFAQIYQLLDVEIDCAYGESFYQEIMPAVIAQAEEKGLVQESEGALIFPFADQNLPPGMLRKSDGATTYFTRDLATLKFRKEKWDPDLIVYEVGAEQTLHFKQVFQAASLLGWFEQKQLIHIPHGLIRLKQGKMSSRKGNVIKLEEVLSEAIERAKKFNDDPDVARQVGIGAVKYNDLKHAPEKGYTFSWDEMLSLDGDSGPYLQYTHARAKSVLAKLESTAVDFQAEQQLARDYSLNLEEKQVLSLIYQYPEVIERSATEFAPHKLCTYLQQLAQSFNSFYNKHQILKSEADCRQLRIALTQATAVIINNCLSLLGICAPDSM